MQQELTVIIPFLNEGEEIANTLESIRTHGGDAVPVLLINDGSTDGFDYAAVAQQYGVRYVVHPHRKGVAFSRDEGVELCRTPYFLLLDGHMRFYDSLWVQRIVEELRKDSRQLLCCQTRVLWKPEDSSPIEDRSVSHCTGARINLHEDTNIWEAVWTAKEHTSPEEPAVEIACVLGAAYACSKHYWQYLKGLEGLRSYGSDELFISIKVWLEGGRCRLLKDVVVGHLYRKSFPYANNGLDQLYNKLYTGELLLPSVLKWSVFKALEEGNPALYRLALSELIGNAKNVKRMKEYLQHLFLKDFELIVQLNTNEEHSFLVHV